MTLIKPNGQLAELEKMRYVKTICFDILLGVFNCISNCLKQNFRQFFDLWQPVPIPFTLL